MKKFRIIVSFIEGEFMLIHDFDTVREGLDYAKQIGCATYEVTDDYNLEEWVVIDPSIDATQKLSFAYNKNSRNYHRK